MLDRKQSQKARVKDPRRDKARKLSEQGLTQALIADRIGVSRRTIERWASEDGWGAQRKAERKVVSINKPRPQPSLQNSPESTHSPPLSPSRRRQRSEINELEIVESAIVSLDLLLDSMGGSSDGGNLLIDTRGVGGVAGALVKLLEYRRKVKPPTAKELAEQMIALDVSPAEVVAELKRLGWAAQRA